MLRKLSFVAFGLMLTMSSVGCCCLGGWGYGANRCAPCNNGCAPGGAYYPPQGAFYQGGMTSQTAFASDISQTALAPVTTGYTTTTAAAFVPTSTAALMPGAIQGPPIYNTAAVPINSLPVY